MCVPSNARRSVSQPFASLSWCTAAAECFKVPESAYTALDRSLADPTEGSKYESSVCMGDRERYYMILVSGAL